MKLPPCWAPCKAPCWATWMRRDAESFVSCSPPEELEIIALGPMHHFKGCIFNLWYLIFRRQGERNDSESSHSISHRIDFWCQQNLDRDLSFFSLQQDFFFLPQECFSCNKSFSYCKKKFLSQGKKNIYFGKKRIVSNVTISRKRFLGIRIKHFIFTIEAQDN